MATVTAFIRTQKKENTLCNVRFRLSDGREIVFYGKSNLYVYSYYWDAKREQIKSKIVFDSAERSRFNNAIMKHKRYINEAYNEASGELDKGWLNDVLERWYNPEKYEVDKTLTFFDYYEEFANRPDISKVRQKNLRVVGETLKRFEQFRGEKITLDGFNRTLLKAFENFVRDEYKIINSRHDIYGDMAKSRLPRKRARNTVISIMERLSPFFTYAIKNKYTKNNPFDDYKVGVPTYGSPIFISSEERDKIMNTDLSHNFALAIQRDIFVFQCLVGCRVSDLERLTEDNIADGVLYYIPNKTSKDKPVTVEVPLSDSAKMIIDRYKEKEDDRLLPFISTQKYNDAIKQVFLECGVTRKVTWLNPQTGKGEQRPINEIASSHMARRTFIGNLYAKVKDPNLVGSLSGHSEGSKAFARYRNIDLEMKKDLINEHL